MTEASKNRPFAVVTGASSGIGYELARQFADHGYDLLVVAETDDIARSAQALGGEVHVQPLVADLATYDGVERLWTTITELGRPLDAVAINAGVGVGGAGFAETDLREELAMIALNVSGVVHLAKRVLPAMIARGEGRILFTSSIAATMPAPYMAVYGGTKAFVQSFAEALRNEAKDTGVTITALMPGPTDTNFFDRAHMENTPVAQKEKDDPAEVAKAGFDALMRGDDHVVAGATFNKVQVIMNRALPETTQAAMHRQYTEPETK